MFIIGLRRAILMLFLAFCMVESVTSQSDTISRQFSDKINLKATVSTKDGGYITCGGNGIVMKLDKAGVITWSRRILVGSARYTTFNSLIQLPDGGIVAVGTIQDNRTGDFDGAVWKLDSNGKTIWVLWLDSQVQEEIFSASFTADGGVLCVGTYASDGLVFKVSSRGKIVWSKIIGTSSADALYAVAESSNSYTAIGSANIGSADQTLFVVRLSSTGDVIWKRLYSSLSGFQYMEGTSVTKTSKGAFVIAGIYDTQGLILKMSPAGKVLWAKLYGSNALQHYFFSITSVSGGFVAAGDMLANTTGWDGWLVKIDGRGNAVWGRRFSSSNDSFSTVSNSAVGLVITGYSLGSSLPYPWYSVLMNVGSTGKLQGCGVLKSTRIGVAKISLASSAQGLFDSSSNLLSSKGVPEISKAKPITRNFCGE